MNIIEAENISVVFDSYGDIIKAVDHVDFILPKGQTIGIVGESGSGKSTFARVLSGLQIPSSGEVKFMGSPIWNGNKIYEGALRKEVQMVFQDPYGSLNPRMRIVKAVAEAIRHHQGLDKKSSTLAAFDLLESMGISNLDAQKFPSKLSGGQRQRASVARALSAQPSVLIADEPTSAIDQSAQAQLLGLFNDLIKNGLSIVLVSHDLGIIRYLSDYVYVMKDGIFVESGTSEEIFNNPKEDYTKKLISSIPGRSIT
jgi:ABC-type dipeptide/oligopeptide/nickel transport system ATPase subunit